MRRKVVLYNPRAVFYSMPLALLAVGSYLDPDKYEVRIVDGRLERDPVGTVLSEIGEALCLGMTVLTGAPIHDALKVTRAARAQRPDLPVVWGGWHPSLFPIQTVAEAGIDAAIVGQGEEAFAELLDRLAEGADLAGLPGTACRPGPAHRAARAGAPASEAEVVLGAPRPLRDLNALPPLNYDLVPVERYFALKRQRQLDYISSQGCRFRCTFCADPFVYKRGWFGLEPARMGEELEALWHRYRFQEVAFQDETFFTSARRVGAVAEELLRRGTQFAWTATMRADQGFRLDESVLVDCRRAGLRRVMVGLESGSQEMLDRIKKDITLEQVFDTAEKCRRLGIGILFNLIVGFPDEPPESVEASLQAAKQLRAMSPEFEIAIFYYKPYPGNQMADQLMQQGYQFPRTLEEWADFDYVGSSGPWVSPEKHELIERFRFYQRLAWSRPTPLRAPLQVLARWRCERDFYGLPVEKTVIERLRPPVTLS